ncbi:MAG: peptidase modulator of gyrase [Frankiales bacterium]|nr:peptidase modulator of gyrase [Frankiales bacterium]
MTHEIDPAFLALPLKEAAAAALQAAQDAGATHADLRVERLRGQDLSVRDGRLESLTDDVNVGLAVRVIHDGTWGFASSADVTPDEAARLAREAVAMAKVARPLNSQPVELADEPVYADVTWVSDYETDPFSIDPSDKVALFAEWSSRLLQSDQVDHVDISLQQAMEGKFYADSAGTMTTQQRVRLLPQLTGTRVDPGGGFETMRTIAAPVGRGWEYLSNEVYDWDDELAQLPERLVEKAKASSVEPGRYDLVIDPSNLWLTIHESIGHATELDRALGYEAAYAGTSFATIDQLNTLKYGSDLMHVTGDRHTQYGLSTVGYDDEGVAAQQWDLIKGGTLVGYQLDRRMARQNAAVLGTSRSNGCAYADGPHRVPVQRMPNVSLQPDPNGPSLEALIGGVERGIYVVGDTSWSIDMQRYNFQFTGQLRDVAYQTTTTEFWGSMEVVGGPETYVLGGAFNCGKAQPSQTAAVSHGCPAALFRGVNILNTVREAGR